jgi:hypothetical protein
MRRRRFLSVASALLVSPLSGCISGATTDTPGSPGADEELPPTGDGTLSEFDARDPFETRRVGEASEAAHHRAVVWNDDADRRTIEVELRAAATGESIVDATTEFPAYGSLRIEIYRARDYVLDIALSNEDERMLGIRRDFVDCNDSATHVAVRPDGSVRARVFSTALACDVASSKSTVSKESSAVSMPTETATATPTAESTAETATSDSTAE